MNLEDLQSARNRERRTDSLQSLPDSFYTDAGAFVGELRARREEVAAAAADPFDSAEVNQLTNSIKTAENTIEAIYERRVGKVVKLASLDAAGMSADDAELTSEERDLFDTLTGAIERNRQVTLGTAEGKIEAATEPDERTTEEGEATTASTPTGSEPPSKGASTDPDPAAEESVSNGVSDEKAIDANGSQGRTGGGLEAADAMGAPAGTAPTETDTDPAAGSDPDGAVPEEDDTDTIDRATVRITRDVGEIMGIDGRNYRLTSDDVIQLPAANARPLVDRDAAERLDPS
jgi:DNA replication factor GINS